MSAPRIDWRRAGALVQAARQRERESLREFGRRHQVNHVSLCRLEQGKPIKADFYMRLAAGLRVDPFELGGIKRDGT